MKCASNMIVRAAIALVIAVAILIAVVPAPSDAVSPCSLVNQTDFDLQQFGIVSQLCNFTEAGVLSSTPDQHMIEPNDPNDVFGLYLLDETEFAAWTVDPTTPPTTCLGGGQCPGAGLSVTLLPRFHPPGTFYIAVVCLEVDCVGINLNIIDRPSNEFIMPIATNDFVAFATCANTTAAGTFAGRGIGPTTGSNLIESNNLIGDLGDYKFRVLTTENMNKFIADDDYECVNGDCALTRRGTNYTWAFSYPTSTSEECYWMVYECVNAGRAYCFPTYNIDMSVPLIGVESQQMPPVNEDICSPEEFVTKGGPPPECDPAMEVVVAELNNDGSGNGIDFDWGEDAGNAYLCATVEVSDPEVDELEISVFRFDVSNSASLRVFASNCSLIYEWTEQNEPPTQSIRTGEGRLTFAFRHFTSGNFLGAEFRVLPKERLAGGNDEIVDGGSKAGLVIGIVAAVLATAVVLGVVGFMCNKHNKQKSGCCYCGSESSRGRVLREDIVVDDERIDNIALTDDHVVKE